VHYKSFRALFLDVLLVALGGAARERERG